MTIATIKHRALDGSLVTIRTDLDAREPFTSYLNLRISSRLHEFISGDRGSAEADARDIGVRAFREEYRFQSGILRFGTAAQFDPVIKLRTTIMVAVWEGENYSLMTHAYKAKNSMALLSVFDRIRILESREGLVLAPRKPASTPVNGVVLLKELPSAGLLQIYPATRDAVRRLPRWRGRRVAGGELFVDGEESSRRVFTLAGRTAFTDIVTEPDHDVDQVLPALAKLQVTWSGG